jgi:hypothetical protein
MLSYEVAWNSNILPFEHEGDSACVYTRTLPDGMSLA